MSKVSTRALSASERELKDQCEETIRAGLTSFIEVGQALMVVRDNRLYREAHATFEDYCAAEWQMSRTRGYELINAAAVVSAIADTGMPGPANEAQARALSRVPEDQRAEVWQKTLDETEGKPTAAAVDHAAGRKRPADPAIDPVDAMHDALAGIDAHLAAQAAERTEDHTEEDGDRPDPDASSAQPEVSGVNSGSAPAELESRDDSEPADEQPQGRSGASVPAAAPQGKTFDEVLDEHVPNADPHQRWRAAFLKAIRQSYALSEFADVDIATNGNDLCFDELIRLRDFLDDKLRRVQEIRLASLPDNVREFRRPA